MSIIKNIEELQKYVRIAGTLDFSLLEPYRDLAIQQELFEYCGEDIIDDLSRYNSTSPITQDPRKAALLPYVAMPLAYFTLKYAAPFIDLQITNAGFAVISNTNLAPASDKRVNTLIKAIESMAYSSLDRMIAFLEANVDKYPKWEKSQAFSKNFNCFVRNGADIKAVRRVDNPSLTAYIMRSAFIRAQQFKVDSVISVEMGEDIRKKMLNGNLNKEYKSIIDHLKAATYYYAAAEEDPKANLEITAEKYISEVRKIIDANPERYPIYKASSAYTEPVEYNNNPTTDSSSIIMLGNF